MRANGSCSSRRQQTRGPSPNVRRSGHLHFSHCVPDRITQQHVFLADDGCAHTSVLWHYARRKGVSLSGDMSLASGTAQPLLYPSGIPLLYCSLHNRAVRHGCSKMLIACSRFKCSCPLLSTVPCAALHYGCLLLPPHAPPAGFRCQHSPAKGRQNETVTAKHTLVKTCSSSSVHAAVNQNRLVRALLLRPGRACIPPPVRLPAAAPLPGPPPHRFGGSGGGGGGGGGGGAAAARRRWARGFQRVEFPAACGVLGWIGCMGKQALQLQAASYTPNLQLALHTRALVAPHLPPN